jgi:hypothetical protein
MLYGSEDGQALVVLAHIDRSLLVPIVVSAAHLRMPGHTVTMLSGGQYWCQYQYLAPPLYLATGQ